MLMPRALCFSSETAILPDAPRLPAASFVKITSASLHVQGTRHPGPSRKLGTRAPSFHPTPPERHTKLTSHSVKKPLSLKPSAYFSCRLCFLDRALLSRCVTDTGSHGVVSGSGSTAFGGVRPHPRPASRHVSRRHWSPPLLVFCVPRGEPVVKGAARESWRGLRGNREETCLSVRGKEMLSLGRCGKLMMRMVVDAPAALAGGRRRRRSSSSGPPRPRAPSCRKGPKGPGRLRRRPGLRGPGRMGRGSGRSVLAKRLPACEIIKLPGLLPVSPLLPFPLISSSLSAAWTMRTL